MAPESRRIPLGKILYHPAITITFYARKLSNSSNLASSNDIVERKGSKFRCCNGHEETGWNVIREFPPLKLSADGLNDMITVKGKSLEFLNLFGKGSRRKEKSWSSNLTSMLISYYFSLLKFWHCFKSESIFESIRDPSEFMADAWKRNQVQFVLSDRLRGACTWLIIPRVPVTNARNAVSFPPKPAANQFQLSSTNERTKKNIFHGAFA